MNRKHIIVTAAITAVAVFLLTTLMYVFPIGRFFLYKISGFFGETEFSKFTKAEYIIENEFVGEYDKEKMLDYALAGYIAALGDPYTSYMNQNTYRSMNEAMDGSYRGIGITAGMSGKNIYVKTIAEGSPAQSAGLMVGDIILSINGTDYNTDTYVEALSTIKGTKSGEDVVLRIKREEEIFEVTVTVGKISRGYISGKMLDDNVGYIRVKTFGTDVGDEFEQKVKTLEKEGMTSLIIDLRSNPGGSLEEVVQMTDLLMGEGIITTVKSGSGITEEYKSDKNETDVPMCVLINSESASASELMAAALGHHKKAVLVGEKTYGKGVVQGVFDLGDGTALRLTIAKYFTPSGECIDGVGVEPHKEVLMPDGELISEEKIGTDEDVQLHEAILVLTEKAEA